MSSRRGSIRSSASSGAEAVPKIVSSTIIDLPTDVVWEALRDFNGHDRWHPVVAASAIERGHTSDKVGCVRRFTLKAGGELREQLLAMSDLEQSYSYCLLDTPVPLFNYVSHVSLLPVTDGNRTFWRWEAGFTAKPGDSQRLSGFVAEHIQQAGFDAMRRHLAAAQ
jgi:Polyketide cyclase / dehydrase and lipid transport